MVDASDMTERHRRLLERLGELSMSLAERLHERAMAAETQAEAEGLALAFQRVSRSLRQTLALEARLERERQRAHIEAARHAEETRREQVQTRRARVDTALTRLIWTEGERGERGELLVELDNALKCEIHDEAFLEGPVEAVIARLRQDLGLPPADNDADGDAPPETPSSWRSSA